MRAVAGRGLLVNGTDSTARRKTWFRPAVWFAAVILIIPIILVILDLKSQTFASWELALLVMTRVYETLSEPPWSTLLVPIFSTAAKYLFLRVTFPESIKRAVLRALGSTLLELMMYPPAILVATLSVSAFESSGWGGSYWVCNSCIMLLWMAMVLLLASLANRPMLIGRDRPESYPVWGVAVMFSTFTPLVLLGLRLLSH
jgi:hypothetical protein